MLPVADTLPISGAIITDVAFLTLQLKVVELPADTDSGEALKDSIMGSVAGSEAGGVAGSEAGGCVILIQPVIAIRRNEARTNNFFITYSPFMIGKG